ncbi:MAG: DUF6034 family protein [Oscillospiraceae bacterium]|nr:DUF6034 family protein [Oscillospiraceae bacterium]
MEKRFIALVLPGTLLAMATGCQTTPETSAVTSKNNGALESAIYSESNTGNQDEKSEDLQDYTLSSADGTVRYTISLDDNTSSDAPMPVIRVTPHSITSEEARTVAQLFFGSEDVYTYSEQMSKYEIEEKILSLKQAINDRSTLVSKYGDDDELIDAVIAQYNSMISYYELQYESAPETVEKTLCDWTFHPLSYYMDEAGLDTSTEDYIGYNQTVYIRALSQIDNIQYQFWACNRDEADYRVHYLNVFMDYTGADRDLYSTVKPTDEQIVQVCEKAETILSQLNMGQWEIASCEVMESMNSDGETVYHIYIIAMPVYEGITMTYLGTLIDQDTSDAYISNYDYEGITFDYSGSSLISFRYEGMLDVVEVLNDDTSVLSLTEAAELFEAYASYLKADTYSSSAASLDVDVNHVELGLVRIRIQNNETDFYLVPTYTFYGTTISYNEDGDILAETEDVQLAVINAVDGSIIDTTLGY